MTTYRCLAALLWFCLLALAMASCSGCARTTVVIRHEAPPYQHSIHGVCQAQPDYFQCEVRT
jgi:hypothetical protein